MKALKYLPLLFLLSDACIDRLDIDVASTGPRLVVDGLITDEPGPYQVKLFLSSDADEDLRFPQSVAGAQVKIISDAGEEEVLSERFTGTYETRADGIRGVVGRQYKIEIQTSDQKKYASPYQRMEPSGTIENLYAEFNENAINQNDITKPQDIFQVFADATGTDNAKNFFRWRWTGVYEVRTYPELRVRFETEPDGTIKKKPDPLPCSGYVAVGDEIVQNSPCECCNCWVTEYSQKALVSNNQPVSDVELKRNLLNQVEVSQLRFYSKYHLEVEQLSLTDEAYAFWKNTQAQQQGVGSLFQPNAIKIRSNVKCISNPEEEVLGVFSVSAIARKSFFIMRNQVPKRIGADTITSDCRIIYPGSTNVKPFFW